MIILYTYNVMLYKRHSDVMYIAILSLWFWMNCKFKFCITSYIYTTHTCTSITCSFNFIINFSLTESGWCFVDYIVIYYVILHKVN